MIPKTITNLLHHINTKTNTIQTNTTINKNKPLFPKYEFQTNNPNPDPPTPTTKTKNKPIIQFNNFTKLNLRITQIITTEPIKKSNKLLKIQINLNKETHQIITKITKDYTPKTIIGQQILILTNLKPHKVFNIESQTMILTTQNNKNLFVLSPNNFPSTNTIIS